MNAGGVRRRGTSLVAGVALLIGALAFTGVAPGAEAASKRVGTHWTLTLPAVKLHPAGRAMRVTLVVADSEGTDEGCCVRSQEIYLGVSSRGRTADSQFRQADYYHIDLPVRRDREAFTHRGSLDRASVLGRGVYNGVRYRVRLTFTAAAAAQPSCDGHTMARRGSVTGVFRLLPSESTIGALTIRSSSAWLRHTDGSCGSLSTLAYPTQVAWSRHCMHSGSGLVASTGNITERMVAVREDSGTSAMIRITKDDPALSGEHNLIAMMPANSVLVSGAPPTSGTITGEADGWITGVGNESGSAASSPGAATPADCVGNAVDTNGPTGPFTGNLKINLGLGGYLVPATELTAYPFREVGS